MIRFALVAALVIGLAACDEPKSEREAPPKRKALSDTATVLPPGVRQQWLAALDQAMKERLSIYKGRVRMRRLLLGVTYVPIAALQAECSPFAGIRLIAPPRYTDEINSITLISRRGDDTWESRLGVGRSSPAAISLMDDLCRHLVDRLEAMIARAPPEKP